MRDIIEIMEDSAESQFDEMTKNLPKGKFRCFCGEIDDISNAVSATSNPYSLPICRKCQEKK